MKRVGLVAIVVVCCVCVASIALRIRLLVALGSALIEADPLQHTQVAVVLGGDNFGTRILRAAELVRSGMAPFVLVSGPVQLDQHESDFTIPFAVRHGYSANLFQALPSRADSTRSEASIVGEYLRKQAISKIFLVTSNYHTRRAAFLFRSKNPGLTVIAVSAPDPDFTPNAWWKSRNGQKIFLNEWTKTIATHLGH